MEPSGAFRLSRDERLLLIKAPSGSAEGLYDIMQEEKKMAVPYNHKAIEAKWRTKWAENPVNVDDGKKEKYYCLDMFPYPSGNGLHVGHWRGYVISDVWSRYKMQQGYYLIHPMGWDAFGLPADYSDGGDVF